MSTPSWPFDIPPDGMVVTTSNVTRSALPILEVSHEWDEEDGPSWQFHCENGDYDPSVLQPVALSEILALDAEWVIGSGE